MKRGIETTRKESGKRQEPFKIAPNDIGEESGFLYDAFISYRHLSVDKKAAVCLQQFLEKHKRKDGKSLRIFRDQSELPTSGDLGKDIRYALDQSRYLILICSSVYQESKWCMEELNYFRQLHGESNQYILPILVEGEPEESFPQQLRWETQKQVAQDGASAMVRVEIEPLGADIRAANERQMIRLLKTEYLRVLAPILGCSFDDLYKRAYRRRRRRILYAASAVTAVAVAFSCYSLYMLNRIQQKQQELYENESLRLAEVAEQHLEDNDYQMAMLLSEAALPKHQKKPERKLVPEALEALRSAVTQRMAEEDSAVVQCQTRMKFNMDSWQIQGSYDKGHKLAVSDYENTYLYDTDTGKLLFSCEGMGVFFNEAATRAARRTFQTEKLDNEAVSHTVIELYTIPDGQMYFEGQYPNDDSTNCMPVWDGSDERCYIMWKKYQGEGEDRVPVIRLLDIIDGQGSPSAEKILTERLRSYAEAPEYGTSYIDPYYWGQFHDYVPDGEINERAAAKKEILDEWTAQIEAEGVSVGGIDVTDEFALLRISYSDPKDGSQYGSLPVLLDGQENEEFSWGDLIEGECYLDQTNGYIYQKLGYDLYVLRVYPENHVDEDEKDTVQTIGEDGRLCLSVEVDLKIDKYFDRARLRVGNVDDTQHPILDEWIRTSEAGNDPGHMYYTTPDIDEIFLQTKTGEFKLWNEDEGYILDFFVEEDASALAMDKEGKYLAVGCKNKNGACHVEVRSHKDGQVIFKYVLPEGFSVRDLEFEGNHLLIAGTSDQTIILDLDSEKKIAEIPAPCSISYRQDGHLTSDGLLFCTSDTNFSQYYLEGIYDIHTGERVFGEALYYRYDEATDTLVYQTANHFSGRSASVHMARRNEDGIFEDQYSFFPEGGTMTLRGNLQCLDNQYFILNGTEGCEVYEVASGDKVLSLKGDSQYILAHGMVYDLSPNASKKVCGYPILELDDLREQAERYLTSDLGTRRLTDREKESYHITK